jgi:hypothetical protein
MILILNITEGGSNISTFQCNSKFLLRGNRIKQNLHNEKITKFPLCKFRFLRLPRSSKLLLRWSVLMLLPLSLVSIILKKFTFFSFQQSQGLLENPQLGGDY